MNDGCDGCPPGKSAPRPLSPDGQRLLALLDRYGCPDLARAVRADHSGGENRILNMYSGFSVVPDFKDCVEKCELYLAHIGDNIAGGDGTLNAYILNWMASGVQDPEDPE